MRAILLLLVLLKILQLQLESHLVLHHLVLSIGCLTSTLISMMPEMVNIVILIKIHRLGDWHDLLQMWHTVSIPGKVKG